MLRVAMLFIGFLSAYDPYDLSDGSAVPHDRYIATLDGLRGLAAMLVASFDGQISLSKWDRRLFH
jgi:hypothetical protein